MSVPVVYDTMIFLQAASRPDRTHTTFQAVYDRHVDLALSPALLAEIQDVLNRDAIQKKFPALTSEAVDVFIEHVLARGNLHYDVERLFSFAQHTDDDHVLNLAIRVQAHYLVAWETRLLMLNESETPESHELHRLAPLLKLVTPIDFVSVIRETLGD